MKRIIIGFILVVMFASGAWAKGRIQDGLCKVYLRDGQDFLFMIEMQRDAKRDGAAFQFYPNGEVEKMAWYRNGILDGTYRAFWSDGTQRSLLDYHNGIPDGRAYHYDRKGRLQCQLGYSQGRLSGTGYYYEDGALDKTVEYRKGRAVQIK